MRIDIAFFERVFGGVLRSGNGELEIRLVNPETDEAQKRFYGSIRSLRRDEEYLRAKNKSGFNLYWGCAVRDAKSHKPVRLPCLWGDVDAGPKKNDKNWIRAFIRIRPLEPRPTYILASGHGLQLFWLLKQAIEIEEARDTMLLKGLTERFGGDLSCAEVARVMRVPGSFNWKKDRPRVASGLYGGEGPTYDYAALAERYCPANGKTVHSSISDSGYWRFFSEHLDGLWTPNADGWARARCPFHEDSTASLGVNSIHGGWKCHAESCGLKGTFEQFRERLRALDQSNNHGAVSVSVRDLKKALRAEMKQPPKKVEWDVPGFFPARASILLAGRKGEGKSYFLQALSKASTEGSELIPGLPVVVKPFLYLAREGTPELYDQRFGEIGFDFRRSKNTSFVLWGPWMKNRPPEIGDPIYREWAMQFAPCAIAIDGIRRFFKGDENSSEVMDPIGQEMTAWTVNGATVYAVHHRGKSRTTESRGSSAIEDAVSVQYVVEAERVGSRISTIQVRCVKNWYGEEKALLLEPHWDNGRFWFTGKEDTKAAERWALDKERVLNLVPVMSWMPRTEILKELEEDLGRDHIMEILESEHDRGLRWRHGKGRGGPIEYRRVKKPANDEDSAAEE